MKKRWLALIPAFFILSCTKKDALPVSPYVLNEPAAPVQIDRDSLVRNNSFQTAYGNGTIRSTQALITWQQSTDPDFFCYKIIRNNTLCVAAIDSAPKAWFVDTQLQQNSWYTYTVATVLKNGRSKIDTITIRTPKFLPPSINQIRVDTTGTIFLSWVNRAETAQKYVLERKLAGNADYTYQKVAELDPSTSMFYDTAYAIPYTYVYRLTGWNQYEHTPYFETMPVLYTMTAPEILSASQIGTTRSVRLTFVDNSNAEACFKVYRKHWNGQWAMIGRAPANATEFIDADSAGIGPDSSFYYKVECYNRAHSNASSEIFMQFMKKGIDLSPSALQFPNTDIGSSESLMLTIRNAGSTALAVSNVVSSNPRFIPGRMSFTVPAGSSTTLPITFSPTSYSKQTGIITLTNNLAIGGLVVPVSGLGTIFTPINEGFEKGGVPFDWLTSAAAMWNVRPGDTPYEGSYCIRSGAISDNDSSFLFTKFASSGKRTISFRYRVSSEAGHDGLKFTVGSLQFDGYSGETGWQNFSIDVQCTGSMTMTWTYYKDASGTSGSDCAWIDNVVVK